MKVGRALLSVALVLSGGALFRCGGRELPTPPTAPQAVAPPAVLLQTVAPGSGEPLHFPPAVTGRRARSELKLLQPQARDDKPKVLSPDVPADAPFVMHAKTLRIELDRPIKGAIAGAGAGKHLRITPAIAGQVRWEGPSTLAFVADHYLDPADTYRASLHDVVAADGTQLPPWECSFKTDTAGVLAGKTLAHKPTVGAPRVVAALPEDGQTVSHLPRLRVLYDQPVSVAQVKPQIRLTRRGRGGQPVSLRFGHAPSDRFGGSAIDRRHVIVISAAAPLQSGADYVFEVADHPSLSDAQAQRHDLSVAQPLALAKVECGWYTPRTEVCERASDGALTTSKRTVHFVFNNPLKVRAKQLRAHVRVTPFVRNLEIAEEGGWYQGRIVLNGDFRPSTQYRVTLSGLRDRHGGRQSGVIAQDITVLPLGATVTMPEGFVALDQQHTKAFRITSRNVKRAQLKLWRVGDDDVAAFRKALRQLDDDDLGGEAPTKVVPIDIRARRDQLTQTDVDLSAHLDKGASYLASLKMDEVAFGAQPQRYPRGSAAARPAVALLRSGDQHSISALVHSSADSTLVYVSRRHDGAPLAGAEVEVLAGGSKASGGTANGGTANGGTANGGTANGGLKAKTDAQGVALLNVDTRAASEQIVRVALGGEQLLMPLQKRRVTVEELFPDLAGRPTSSSRAMIFTDRGIYRPGATLRIKASLFAQQRDKLKPKRDQAVRLRVLNGAGEKVCQLDRQSGALGGVKGDCRLPLRARLGLYRVLLLAGDKDTELARTQVRIAAFEPPRFKVDVAAKSITEASGLRLLKANVEGRYLFGAPMDGAQVTWSLRRRAAAFPHSPLADAGLRFEPEPGWADDAPAAQRWARTGSATLDARGDLRLTQPLDMAGAQTPMRFSLEADVADATHRHAAGRGSVVVHPAQRYAGLRIDKSWLAVGDELEVQLGAMDTAGKPLAGANVHAKLVKVDWRYVAKRGPGGALAHEWRRSENEVARCSVVSDTKAQSCKVKVPRQGDYQIISEVDGRAGGSRWLWAWGRGSQASQGPNKGRVVQLTADRGRYRPGDTARVLVRNPYPEAMALLSVDLGGVVSRQAKRITGAAEIFEIPIKAGYAPHVHAVVSLSPIAASGAEASGYRMGALRLPVTDKGARLALSLSSNKRDYRPGEPVEVTIKVSDQGKPNANAEVALAVVDEGVLRLTNFHAPDPLPHLRPPVPLALALRNSRSGLAELFERSHVAGDGGGDESGAMTQTRRNFVKTALWRPSLRTNAQGEARARFRLPDNLTEFRMMAVAVDAQGKGGVEEASFTVSKPLMVEPVFPRFAAVGDEIELAAMVHNQQAQPFRGTLDMAGRALPVQVPAKSRARVATRMKARRQQLLNLTLQLKDEGGQVVDAAARKLPVKHAGVLAHPQLDGSFRGKQRVEIAIPAGVMFEPDAELAIRTGPDMWPELGSRVEYLLGYPHGCVEQTTSSTLPLLAAREILPRIGLDAHDDDFYRKRIEAGMKRLAKMATPSGGLAYWPGGREPHVYGTAYAIRAVVRAHKAEMPVPDGLLQGMTDYLGKELLNVDHDPSLRASIAESLAEVGALPPHSADALYDLRDKLTPFGRASLALALGALPEQRDRVDKILDELEASFDERGEPKDEGTETYWGSNTRTQAQAMIALTRLRPSSKRLHKLASKLAKNRPGYTTQSVAFSLLALADHLVSRDPRSAEVSALIDGSELAVVESESGQRSFRVPLKELVGKKVVLELTSVGEATIGFALQARYHLPLDSDSAVARASEQVQSSATGPDIYRVITDEAGREVDLKKVRVGQLLRVAVYAKLRDSRDSRYLAITDPLPAGLEPVNTKLATVAQNQGVPNTHPLAGPLRRHRHRISHMELHDDRVQIYFDNTYRREAAASYLVRATTPGDFALPPTSAELMYEPDSTSYGTPARVVVQ